MNVVALMGRLTADVEVAQTPNGIPVAKFSIAVDRYSNGERKADFINCVAWRETAENIGRFFRKGNKIGINGSIQTRQYQDKEGKNRTAFEVLVDRFHFCESANNGRSQQTGNFAPAGSGYGQPRVNLDINPQPPQPQNFVPQQQTFIPYHVPKFQPAQAVVPQHQPQQYPTGFELVNSADGDMPF